MIHLPSHQTKIVCTIGPASDSPEVLEQLLRSGMNVARINLAHGSLTEQRGRILRIRAAAAASTGRVTILADLPGPKLRIGILPAPLTLTKGQHVRLAHLAAAQDDAIPLDIPELVHPLKRGDPVFLNDGFIALQVESVDDQGIHCQVKVGGTLVSHKGVNLPTAGVAGGAITAHDKELMAFALDLGVDALGISFVDSAADVQTARQAASAMGYSPFLIAKIERKGAWHQIDAILEAADGIMVARGDLGVEVPIEDIALIQKRLIRKAREAHKPVITATQMLESMVSNPRPTRAEVTDVANAILDGTDCVMLSEESAVGEYPVDAVRMLGRIAQVTERARHEQPLPPMAEKEHEVPSIDSVIANDVLQASERLHPVCIVTPTQSGATAKRVASFRLPSWILAMSAHDEVCQRLAFSYGVHAVTMAPADTAWEVAARDWLAARGIEKGVVILTQGPDQGPPGGTNRLMIIRLEQSGNL